MVPFSLNHCAHLLGQKLWHEGEVSNILSASHSRPHIHDSEYIYIIQIAFQVKSDGRGAKVQTSKSKREKNCHLYYLRDICTCTMQVRVRSANESFRNATDLKLILLEVLTFDNMHLQELFLQIPYACNLVGNLQL